MARTAKEKTGTVKAYEAAVKLLADAKEKNSKNATPQSAKVIIEASQKVKETLASVNRERFLTLGQLRVNNVLAALTVLEQCANRKSYVFNDVEIVKAFNAITGKVTTVHKTFAVALQAPANAPTEAEDDEFTF